MVERLTAALGIALLGALATTQPAAAARSPDLTEVAVGTFLVALGAMLVLFVIYLLKVFLGLEKPLPPEEPHGSDHH